ncbi:MAG: hypothetical protein RL418_474, partial [Actinomycetota bacterium]
MKPGINKAELSNTISPKSDLFRHVNGSWLESTEIPEDKAVYGSFYLLADDAELAVREVLEDATKNPTHAVAKQIGDLYASFLDEERIEKLGSEPIQAGLEKIAEISNAAEYFSMLGAFERAGVAGLWGSYVDNDPGDPERYLVHLYQGGIGLPDKEYYTDEKYEDIRKEYVPHISRMLMLAGWSANDAIDAAQTIFEFESKVAKHHWSRVESRDAEKTYNLRSFEELKELNKKILWDEYLAGASLKSSLLEWNVVMMPSFFEGIADLLI